MEGGAGLVAEGSMGGGSWVEVGAGWRRGGEGMVPSDRRLVKSTRC